jgi:hypothetical protein
MYLGTVSLSRLCAFLSGHNYAISEMAIPQLMLPYRETFQGWLARSKLGIDTDQVPEETVVSLTSESDTTGYYDYLICFDLWWEECVSSEAPVEERSPLPAQTHGLLGLLELIRVQPSGLLFYPSLTRLRAFIDGYLFAFRDYSFPPPTDLDLMVFETWIQTRFHRFKSTYRWEKLILFYYPSEPLALQRFFVLLDEYRGLTEKGEDRSSE